jgi:hypothetical protein
MGILRDCDPEFPCWDPCWESASPSEGVEEGSGVELIGLSGSG